MHMKDRTDQWNLSLSLLSDCDGELANRPIILVHTESDLEPRIQFKLLDQLFKDVPRKIAEKQKKTPTSLPSWRMKYSARHGRSESLTFFTC